MSLSSDLRCKGKEITTTVSMQAFAHSCCSLCASMTVTLPTDVAKPPLVKYRITDRCLLLWPICRTARKSRVTENRVHDWVRLSLSLSLYPRRLTLVTSTYNLMRSHEPQMAARILSSPGSDAQLAPISTTVSWFDWLLTYCRPLVSHHWTIYDMLGYMLISALPPSGSSLFSLRLLDRSNVYV